MSNILDILEQRSNEMDKGPNRSENKSRAARTILWNAEAMLMPPIEILRRADNFEQQRKYSRNGLACITLSYQPNLEQNTLIIEQIDERSSDDGCLAVIAAYAKTEPFKLGEEAPEFTREPLAAAIYNNPNIHRKKKFISLAAHGLVNRSLDEKTYERMLRIASTYDGTNH